MFGTVLLISFFLNQRFHISFHPLSSVKFSNMFKVQTIGGNVFEGEIFAIDPVTKAIALQQQDGGFVVVNSNFIQQIQGDLSKVKAPDINALGLTYEYYCLFNFI